MLLIAAEVAGDESSTIAGAAAPNDMIESCPLDSDMESLPESRAMSWSRSSAGKPYYGCDNLLLRIYRVEPLSDAKANRI